MRSAQLERRAGARESRPGGRNRDGSWVLRQAAGPGPGPGAGRLGQAAGGRPLTPVSYGLPVLLPARRADRNSPAVRPSLSVSPTRTPSHWQPPGGGETMTASSRGLLAPSQWLGSNPTFST